MDARTAAPPLSETAVPTLFLALELSRSTWLIALHSPVADKVSQHRLEGGDADRQIGQPTGAAHRHRAGLAVAAAPARQRARAVVPCSRGRGKRADAPDHAGGDGTQADRVVVAVSGRWHRAGGGRAEGLSRCAAGGLRTAEAARDGRGPVSPRASRPSQRWVPSSRPRSAPRTWDVGQVLTAGRPDTRWCGAPPHRCTEASPNPPLQPEPVQPEPVQTEFRLTS
jgi:hypothetical protein